MVVVRPQIPNFNKLAGISFLAAVMSLGYSTIAIGTSIHTGRGSTTNPAVRPAPSLNPLRIRSSFSLKLTLLDVCFCDPSL